jgi:hypothetical protein
MSKACAYHACREETFQYITVVWTCIQLPFRKQYAEDSGVPGKRERRFIRVCLQQRSEGWSGWLMTRRYSKRAVSHNATPGDLSVLGSRLPDVARHLDGAHRCQRAVTMPGGAHQGRQCAHAPLTSEAPESRPAGRAAGLAPLDRSADEARDRNTSSTDDEHNGYRLVDT